MRKQEQPPVGIAIIHPHALLRAALVELTERLGGYAVVLQATDLPEFIERSAGNAPATIMLLGMGQDESDGMAAIRWIREHRPGTHTLVLGGDDDDAHILHVMHAGAGGIIHQRDGPMQLRTAFEHLLTTGHYHTERVHACLLRHPDGLSDEERRRKRLEEQVKGRHLQALRLLCSLERPTNERIAKRMRISIRTVEEHLSDLFTLFGVTCRGELIIAAVRVGLVKP